MRLAEVVPRDDFILYVVSEDGDTGLFDVSPFMNSEVFAALKDKEEFKRIYNGKFFVEWECGADLSADTIEARWKQTTDKKTEQGAQRGRS